MKFYRYMPLCAIFIFTLLGCSKDESPATPDESVMAVGVYKLIGLNINPAQDIDGNGNKITNILTELPCATGTLNLKDDRTFEWTYEDIRVISITGDLFNISCAGFKLNTTGVWRVKNGLLSLTDNITTVIYSVNGNMLTTTTGGNLPEFKSRIYEKQ